ncbi:GPR endopeptidase [Sedimentibacter hydroxybenzoicus DSM 7310]|uniref:GPR endopeptidase n=1 Tax=Sedimentibacter hydroxybenzoicus DSM 7310 TaxID=1123245 RepID=A0A974BNK7_SEDHY|nr:GPR endopeptidase [Sedimentibacter hydroxybenzoicus]NYB76085.1 GPR endopeptidase [Sedimentibacter hydroxybenzoicus DSM 7310]
MFYRTDLAYEANESLAQKAEGVILKTENFKHGEVVKLEITDETAEKAVGKKRGKYITYETGNLKNLSKESREEVIDILCNAIKEVSSLQRDRILVVGLGNRNITADALGPKTLDKIKVTRQFFKAYNKDFDEDFNEVSILEPGVLGTTGIETINTIVGVVEKIQPTLLIIIDALASRKMRRLCSVVQITDAGIEPGSGIGNMQGSLNEETLGVKVVAIGIPTVVDTATIVNDTIEAMEEALKDKTDDTGSIMGILGDLEYEEKHMFIKEILSPMYGESIVTPSSVDELMDNLSDMLALSINKAVHPGFES